MSEQERLARLDRAMTRLMQANLEALESCRGVLDERAEHSVGDDVEYMPDVSPSLDTFVHQGAPASRSEEGQLYRMALERVRTILVSASEDAQLILGEGNEGG
jgi:hypothetical protein